MSIPTIPDSLYKFLTLLGMLLFGYGFLSNKATFSSYQNKVTDYNAELRRLTNQRKSLTGDLNDLKEQADYYSRRYSLKNPINFTDSGYTFIMTYSGSEKEVALTDTIYNLLKKHKAKEREIDVKDAELDVQSYIVDETEKEYRSQDEDNTLLETWGIILFVIGFIIWVVVEIEKSSKEKTSNHKNCQSCGRQFNSMVKHGTEEDGTASTAFCKDCYTNGSFTNADLTIADVMNQAIKNKGLKKVGALRRKAIESFFGSLERWNPIRYTK